MNRALILGIAIFFAVVGIALMSGDNAALAGHGCNGCDGCSGYSCDGGCNGCGGGFFKKMRNKHRNKGCHGCHGYNDCCGQPACEPACCEPACDSCGSSGCDSCGHEGGYSNGHSHQGNGDVEVDVDAGNDAPEAPEAGEGEDAPAPPQASKRAPFGFRTVKFVR